MFNHTNKNKRDSKTDNNISFFIPAWNCENMIIINGGLS